MLGEYLLVQYIYVFPINLLFHLPYYRTTLINSENTRKATPQFLPVKNHRRQQCERHLCMMTADTLGPLAPDIQSSVKSLRVRAYSEFILIVFSDKQISSVVKLSCSQLRIMVKVKAKACLPPKDLERAIHAIITSQLDYCNSFHVRTGPVIHSRPAASSKCGCTPLHRQGPYFRCATLPLPASCSRQD